MKNLLLYLFIIGLAVLVLSACGGEMANSGRTTANAATNMMSSVGNAANAVANAVSGTTTTGPDNFMKDACQGGMAEVEMGKLAQQKSQNPEIKKFGQMMVTDHEAAGKDLETLAKKKM